MTKEQAKKLLPVIQAWIDGKTIQWKDRMNAWHDIAHDANEEFDAFNYMYRIKPEPREFWINNGLLFFDKESVKLYNKRQQEPAEIIHVKEVID